MSVPSDNRLKDRTASSPCSVTISKWLAQHYLLILSTLSTFWVPQVLLPWWQHYDQHPHRDNPESRVYLPKTSTESSTSVHPNKEIITNLSTGRIMQYTHLLCRCNLVSSGWRRRRYRWYSAGRLSCCLTHINCSWTHNKLHRYCHEINHRMWSIK